MFAISGGMVASFALPASATPLTDSVKPKAPAVTGALALSAPKTAQTPLVSPSFGDISFKGVVKPKPKPVAAPVAKRTNGNVSRSATRVPLAQSAPVPAPRSAGVLGIAASLVGIYYVYGGTTTAGFDCSGFTQYIFDKVGISLPRTAEQQRQFATPVSNPQPGDLVFFGVPAYHMGIYAGNGMMYDSPRTGLATALRSIYSSNVTYGRV